MPEITWEPWDASKGLYVHQPRFRLANIINGHFDSYIRTWARGLAAWHRPVLPTFRRGRGRMALLGAADAAVDDVIHDAGVRQTT